uniref:Integrin alpha FG-GAP repeat containing 1 n=1 Tax=Sphenodon punctatus TaxID=8508 RepID=A0A8D0HH91_SPHPU
MWRGWSLLGLCCFWALLKPGRALQNVTAQLFGAEAYGLLAAFGDFNSDKQTDLFVLRGGSELLIFLADQKEPYFKPKVRLSVTFYDEPLIMDFNGDLIPDVFGVTTESDKPQILIGGNLSWRPALDTQNKMYAPHSHAFIDLNNDLTAGEFSSKIQFETWVNKVRRILKQTSCTKFGFCFVFFLSLFADGDGKTEHLLPACADNTCQKSAIYLSKPGLDQWIPVLQDFRNKDTLWGFLPYKNDQSSMEFSVPIALHIGDYNMDGYPDALAILRNTSGSNQQAFLLENVPCNNANCRAVHRMFKVYWELSDLNQIKDAVVATFFDIYEDGILDIIVLSKGYNNKDLAIHTLKNNFEADAYFVKVIGKKCKTTNCILAFQPFGVNQPGPYIMYRTVDANGYPKNGSAGQLSQSAHLALQLPYNVLGLGRSANFLDHLFVGIPRPLGETSTRKQEWTAIIPNSQLIVIPYPHSIPHSWSAKLYLTPSNIVLLTAIALIGVCIFILAIIGILHWQEKKADDREKRQEAHRFHFDAM